MNPPFSALEKVIEKVINDGAHAILVMPEWCHRKFHKAALAIRLADVLLPRGTKLFSLNGKLFRGTLWRTRLLLMCGHNPRRPRVCEVTQILRPKVTFGKTTTVLPSEVFVANKEVFASVMEEENE